MDRLDQVESTRRLVQNWAWGKNHTATSMMPVGTGDVYAPAIVLAADGDTMLAPASSVLREHSKQPYQSVLLQYLLHALYFLG